jgi:hypothetical protein
VTSSNQLSVPSVADTDFNGTTLPAGWSPWLVESGGTGTVSGGKVELNGSSLASDTMYPQGTRLTIRATFSASSGYRQSIGFTRNWLQFDPDPQFYWDGVDLWALVAPGRQVKMPAGSWAGTEHVYEIDFNATVAIFRIDGVYQTELALEEHLTRRVGLMDAQAFGTGLRVSSVRVGPKDSTINTTHSGSALLSAWKSKPWASGGTSTVAGGTLTQNGTMALTDSMRPTAQRIDIRAKFSGDPNQVVGWSSAEAMDPARSNPTFHTMGGGSLYAYVDSGHTVHIPGSWFGAFHTYRIDYYATKAEFYIDNVWKATITTPPYGWYVRGFTADGVVGDGNLVTDSVTHTPLPEATSSDFSGTSLPAGWPTYTGSPVVGSGVVTLDDDVIGRDATYIAPQRLEIRAQFSGGEHAGIQWGNNVNDTENPGFRTFNTNSDLHAYISPSVNVAIPGNYYGSFHDYRIENYAGHTKFFIDNVEVANLPSEIGWSYRPMAFDVSADGLPLIIDSAKLTSLEGSGQFTSRVHDAGSRVNWTSVAWNGTLPTGSGREISYRVGNTPAPDGTWTSWTPLTASGDPIDAVGRYAQYQVSMDRSSVVHGSPTITDVTLNYRQLFSDTTATDFGAGTHTDTQVATVGDGEVALVPATSTGTFDSRVIDGGVGSTWTRLTWSASIPSGSTLAVAYRVGDTAIPDGTWSAYTNVTSGSDISAAGQYLQYQVTMTPDSGGASPSFEDMTLRT